MAGGGGGGDAGGGDGLLLSLLLFAGTAKFWLVLNDRGGGPAIQRRRRRRAGGDAPLSSSFQHHQNLTPIVSGRNAPWASFLLRKESIGSDDDDDSDDSDSDSAASFGPSERVVETNGRTGSSPVRGKQRKMSGDERMRLMERISLSDAVLTREVSMDFHPKNSNWSHFENYAPSFSPHRHGRRMESVGEETTTETEEEDEDFLWSEPPRRTSTPGDRTTDDATTMMMDYTDHSLRSKKYGRRNSNLDILHFNAGCLPSKLIMVRHGQSEGNIDESLYATKPDNALRLTRLGWDMARMAGRALREQLPPGETVHFIVSPYARTVETFHGIASAWCDPEEFAHVRERSKRLKLWYTKLMEMGLTWHEDPRIREQDFGNYQDPQVIRKAKAERHKFGSFYYRFPHGESASDVFDRVSTFLDSLWRSFESGRAQNYVLIAHGISIRVFLARYFRYSIDQFHMLANPKNCEMVMLAHDGMGRLKLDGRCELELNEVENNDVASDGESESDRRASSDEDGAAQRKRPTTTEVTGYKKYSRLRTLPPQWVRPRTVRMSYKDA